MNRPALEHNAIRPDWLASRQEDAIDPGRPIVDAHHHLYDRRPGVKYLFDDLLSDLSCGHDVRATVYVQARAMLRQDGPAHMRSVGETEFANGVAAMSASGLYGNTRVCAGIVGFADLRLGAAVHQVLEAHVMAAGGTAKTGGRFRGIRQGCAWDPDPSFLNPAYPTTEDMLASAEFLAGFEQLDKLGLSFDAWLFFHQIPRLTALARTFPETPIVLNHCGGILGTGPYAGRRQEVFTQWQKALVELSTCPNVMVKLGGLGMRLSGFEFEAGALPPSSTELAKAWRPWVDACVDAFGTERCMVESNFPVDKGSYSYGIGINAMKRLFSSASEDDRENVFWRTASRFYQLPGL